MLEIKAFGEAPSSVVSLINDGPTQHRCMGASWSKPNTEWYIKTINFIVLSPSRLLWQFKSLAPPIGLILVWKLKTPLDCHRVTVLWEFMQTFFERAKAIVAAWQLSKQNVFAFLSIVDFGAASEQKCTFSYDDFSIQCFQWNVKIVVVLSDQTTRTATTKSKQHH